MIKVGISGKIAAGKSQVEKILQEMNFPVYDLDKISHEILENNETVKTQILAEFKTLDRKELAKIIFSDINKKQKLEEIIYPKLKEEIFNIFKKYENKKMVFVSGALLFKSGFYKFFDKTIFVSAKDEIRLQRLIKRDNLSVDIAKKRLNLQDDSKLADIVIENNSNIAELKEKIEKSLKQIKVN